MPTHRIFLYLEMLRAEQVEEEPQFIRPESPARKKLIQYKNKLIQDYEKEHHG